MTPSHRISLFKEAAKKYDRGNPGLAIFTLLFPDRISPTVENGLKSKTENKLIKLMKTSIKCDPIVKLVQIEKKNTIEST